MILVLTVLLVVVVPLQDAFNVDTKYPVVFKGPSKSYFGYSVAMLRNSKGNWVVVGAPKSNSTQFSQLVEPGEIFKCDFANETCSRVHLDDTARGTEYISQDRKYTEDKNHMWLGVSLDTTPVKEGRIVACGHLWENVIYSAYHLANGVCYTIQGDFDDFTVEKLIPLIARADQITTAGDYKYAYAQMGTSAHFIKDSDSLLLGSPGIYDWRGSSVMMSRADSGIISKRSTSLKNYAVSYVPDPLAELDYVAYFGYAVTSGNFSANKPIQLVIGAPRQEYRGKVYVVEMKNSRLEKIVDRIGEQMGEYFGSALCATDLNNDGADDLLVGAPMHSKHSDEGKVYVFINKGNALFQTLNVQLMGSTAGARFGSSIAALGDINMDGYNDVAIGAPYESDRGAVYIYHGNGNGLQSTFQQKILASQGSSSARGFGISVARGMDLDNNNYPDLVVGAYSSSEVIVFRASPAVYISASLNSDRSQINMDEKDCGGVSCFKLEVCVKYHGKFVPKSIKVKYNIDVDTLKGDDPDAARVKIKTDTGLQQTLQQEVLVSIEKPVCNPYEVHAMKIPRDYMTPIEVYLRYQMVPSAESLQPKFCSTCPLQDQSKSMTEFTKVRFKKQCGADEKCDTDLKISAWIQDYTDTSSVFIIGSKNKITLHAEVFNGAEAAYNTKLLVDLPTWISINQKPPMCNFKSEKHHQLICDLANPLQTNMTVTQDLNLNLEKIAVHDGVIVINVTTTSDSNEEEAKLVDNRLSLELPVQVQSDIYVIGSTLQEQAFYELDNKGKINTNATANFSHAYELNNAGPSPVTQILITVRYPATARDSDQHFMQITNVDTKDGQRGSVFGYCNYTMATLPVQSSGPEEPRSQPAELEEGNEVLLRKRRQTQESVVLEQGVTNATTEADVNIQKEAFVVNCSTAMCETMSCIVGPFVKDSNARLVISFMVNVYNLSSIMGKKDTASIFTEASVTIIGSTRDIQPQWDKPDFAKISTEVKPGGPPPPKEMAAWIIPVSVIGGLLLLILLTVALVKLGFFRRKKKEEMERLMKGEQSASDQQNALIES